MFFIHENCIKKTRKVVHELFLEEMAEVRSWLQLAPGEDHGPCTQQLLAEGQFRDESASVDDDMQ